MNSIMYGPSHVSTALLIFYACVLLPYRELKHAISRILGSIFDEFRFRPRDKTLSFKLPASTFRGLHGDHGDGCAICLVGYEEEDVVSELSRCGHVFHLRCMETWVEQRFQVTCPLCRSLML